MRCGAAPATLPALRRPQRHHPDPAMRALPAAAGLAGDRVRPRGRPVRGRRRDRGASTRNPGRSLVGGRARPAPRAGFRAGSSAVGRAAAPLALAAGPGPDPAGAGRARRLPPGPAPAGRADRRAPGGGLDRAVGCAANAPRARGGRAAVAAGASRGPGADFGPGRAGPGPCRGVGAAGATPVLAAPARPALPRDTPSGAAVSPRPAAPPGPCTEAVAALGLCSPAAEAQASKPTRRP